MIKSKQDYLYYIEADRIAKAIPRCLSLKQKIINWLFPNKVWEFQKNLRKLEYYKNCRTGALALFVRFLIMKKHKKLSYLLGFSIPANVFGPGLSIAHAGTIVINSASKIGANCRIHTCVNIGTQAGYGAKAPIIGENCYIGPGAKLFGNIKIGNNVAIGANAVVTKPFLERNSFLAGVPAKKIDDIDIGNIIIPATSIIEAELVDAVEQIIEESGENLTKKIKYIVDNHNHC